VPELWGWRPNPGQEEISMNRHQRRAYRAQGIDLGQTDIRFNGRTVEARVFVNTDEPAEVVIARIQQAAKGPDKRMAVATGGVLDDEQGKAVWDTFVPIAVNAAKKGGEA
jgi:hypothetical protein